MAKEALKSISVAATFRCWEAALRELRAAAGSPISMRALTWAPSSMRMRGVRTTPSTRPCGPISTRSFAVTSPTTEPRMRSSRTSSLASIVPRLADDQEPVGARGAAEVPVDADRAGEGDLALERGARVEEGLQVGLHECAPSRRSDKPVELALSEVVQLDATARAPADDADLGLHGLAQRSSRSATWTSRTGPGRGARGADDAARRPSSSAARTESAAANDLVAHHDALLARAPAGSPSRGPS